MKITILKIEELKSNPKQPRQNFDREKLNELAQSIKEGDLLQPIIVRKLDGGYQIVAGERRWKALKLLNKKDIPVIIWDLKDNIDALEKSAIENLQRENLTSIERENVIFDLWKSGRYKSKNELARKLGYKATSEGGSEVSRLIRVKEDRERLGASTVLSSKTIHMTKGLPDRDRKDIFKRVEEGELGGGMVKDYVSFKKMQPPEKRFKGKVEVTSETKEKYIYGKLVQSLDSIVMLGVGWNEERVGLINKYAKPKDRRKIVKTVENLVEKWTKILEELGK